MLSLTFASLLPSSPRTLSPRTSVHYEYYMQLYAVVYNHCTSNRLPASASPSGNHGNLAAQDLYNHLVTFFVAQVAALPVRLYSPNLLVMRQADSSSFK